MHRFFRPSLLGAVSPATISFISVIAVLVGLAWGIGVAVALTTIAAAFVVAAVLFVAGGYRCCVTYRPPGAGPVPFVDRLKTFVFALAIVPTLVLARIVGSIENKHLLL
jgi:hypothetical protein